MSERLAGTLDRYLGGVPAQARAAARARALVLETMTHRVLILASRSRLPLDNDSALEALADLWYGALTVAAA
jgi:hypothetical protein